MPSSAKRTVLASLAAVLVAGAGAAYGAYEYKRQEKAKSDAAALTGGNPDQASRLITRYGCGGCHTIPGVRSANGLVGPPLQKFAGRVYIGGVLPNRPDNLVRWIVNPRAVSPTTAMPRTGISEAEARHVAAYLLTLR
ncbi:MAG TPA: c-type cytochrome [Beijerinckiaceae bacterium]|nr:c-type cytochrome [Beijerinckiaceae bacterium]